MDNNNIQRRPQTMLNDFRYPMPTSDKPVDGAKHPARWMWDLGLNSVVYFKINDGHYGSSDQNAKSKEVEMSAMDRGALFNLIENACNDVNFTKGQYVVKKKQFGGQGRMNDHASTLGTFTVIRDSEGMIKIGFTKGTYKVMFPFVSPFESVILLNVNGEVKEDRGFMSRMYAKAFIDFSRKFLDEYEWNNFKPRPPKDGGGNNNRSGGGNNWGGNNNNNNGGQQQQQTRQAPMDFDEEIDF